VDAHLASVRELERQLQVSPPAATVSCMRGQAPSGSFDNANDRDHPAIARAQIDLLATALACGLTRVASLQFAYSRSDIQVFWLGASRTHHGLSHEDTTPTSRDLLIKTNAWYAQQVAYLLQKLDAIADGAGTLLDSTAVVWGNELGRGQPHIYTNIPFVIAGSAGGYFRTGRFLGLGGKPHNDLLVSLCNAFGVATTTFGDPRFCNGGFPALRG
jgi:hypothetical protein